MLLFVVWISICVVAVGGWLLMTIGDESKLIEDESIELDELDRDNIF